MEKGRNETGGHRSQPTVRHTMHDKRDRMRKGLATACYSTRTFDKQQLVGPELGFHMRDVKSTIKILPVFRIHCASV